MATDLITLDRKGNTGKDPVSIRQAWLNDHAPEDPGGSASPRKTAGHPSTGEPTGPTLGTAIQARRRELGMTQQDLAARVNHFGGDMRQSDVSRLERGQVTLPRNDRLQQIALALGIPSGELLAMGGWSGAESSFTTIVGESAGEPVCSVQADSLTAQTEHILQRCREEVAMVRRFLDGERERRIYHP